MEERKLEITNTNSHQHSIALHSIPFHFTLHITLDMKESTDHDPLSKSKYDQSKRDEH